MTPFINFTNPISVLTATALFVLFVWLARETKKSIILAAILGAFIIIISGHAIEYAMVQEHLVETQAMIAKCITFDFIFIALSFISYLWIDDIEAKATNRKSIDNSLDWFWTKV